jgi:hypothetical protein
MPSMSTNYNKKYYEAHKEKQKAYMKQEIQCECGKTITRSNNTNHKKTKKHLQKVNDGNVILPSLNLLLKEMEELKRTLQK